MPSENADTVMEGIAHVFTALAVTMNETDNSFSSRFDENLERLYRRLEDRSPEPNEALEALLAVHSLLQREGLGSSS